MIPSLLHSNTTRLDKFYSHQASFLSQCNDQLDSQCNGRSHHLTQHSPLTLDKTVKSDLLHILYMSLVRHHLETTLAGTLCIYHTFLSQA